MTRRWSLFGKIQIGLPYIGGILIFFLLHLNLNVLEPSFLSPGGLHVGLVKTILFHQPHGEGEEEERDPQWLSWAVTSKDHRLSSCWVWSGVGLKGRRETN